MRDIGRRITRYRLSRYAPPSNAIRRRLRWVWIVAIAWLVWAGLLSQHSFYRLWRLQHEEQRLEREVITTRSDIRALEKESRDPRARRERTERDLRRAGMARPEEIIYRIREGRRDSTQS